MIDFISRRYGWLGFALATPGLILFAVCLPASAHGPNGAGAVINPPLHRVPGWGHGASPSPHVHPGPPLFIHPGQAPQGYPVAPRLPPTYQQHAPNYSSGALPWPPQPEPRGGWHSQVAPPPAIIYSEPSLRDRHLLQEELQLRRWQQHQQYQHAPQHGQHQPYHNYQQQ